MLKELDSQLVIQESGISQTISKREEMTKRLVNEALKGNLKAQELIFRQVGLEAEIAQAEFRDFGIDNDVLENFKNRLLDNDQTNGKTNHNNQTNNKGENNETK